MKTLPIIHTLARSGGTVMSRNIAAMENVDLYSEIHHKGPSSQAKYEPRNSRLKYNIKLQANVWFGYYNEAMKHELANADTIDNSTEEIIDTIELSFGDGQVPVLREWSHMDFFGDPFLKPAGESLLRQALGDKYHLTTAVFIRHPLGTWLSFHMSAPLRETYGTAEGLRNFIRKYRSYAEYFSDEAQIKYRDFMSDQDGTTREICDRLQIDFDPDYKSRLSDFKNITGDPAGAGYVEYRNFSREFSKDILNAVAGDPDYIALCAMLDYDPASVPLGYQAV